MQLERLYPARFKNKAHDNIISKQEARQYLRENEGVEKQNQ